MRASSAWRDPSLLASAFWNMVWQSAAETAANDVVDMPIIRAAAVLAIISLFMDPFPFFEVTLGNSRVPQTVGEQRPHLGSCFKGGATAARRGLLRRSAKPPVE